MRVTTKMMTDSLVYWLSKQTEQLSDAALVCATGKKVNRPSDDPAAAGRMLNDLTAISKYGQYQSNIARAQTWIEAGNTVLDTVLELLNEAQDTAWSQSATDEDIKENAILTLTGLYEQIVGYANERYGGEYMFAGCASDARPFANETAVSGGSAEDILFSLAAAASSVEIVITDQNGNAVRTLTLSGGVEGANAVTWDGLDDNGLPAADGTYDYTVTAADSNGAAVAAYPTYRGSDEEKTVTINGGVSIGLNRNGGELFGESLRAVSEILAALQSAPVDSSALSAAVEDLDGAIEAFELRMTALAMVNTRLESAHETIEEVLNTYENKLSQEQSCDETEAAAILQTLETDRSATIETISSVLGLANLMSLL